MDNGQWAIARAKSNDPSSVKNRSITSVSISASSRESARRSHELIGRQAGRQAEAALLRPVAVAAESIIIPESKKIQSKEQPASARDAMASERAAWEDSRSAFICAKEEEKARAPRARPRVADLENERICGRANRG